MSDQSDATAAYNQRFFASISSGSRRSARRVLPLVYELTPVRSIIDIGCGTGAWLAAAMESGIGDVVGVDGAYVQQHQREIPAERFVEADLAMLTPETLRGRAAVGERRFDLAMSLEVAEHLPEASAAGFVALLTSLAPVVLFSAAIPFQGGTGHQNEQFPSWWAKRFAARGYVPLDVIRDRVWDDASVEWWYRQNTLVFVASDHPAASIPARGGMLDRVHPAHYRRIVDWGMDHVRGVGRRWVSEEQGLRAWWPS